MLPTLLAEVSSELLLNPIKPVLVVLTVIPWAWLVSSRLEKDVRYFHFASARWNGAFIAGGIAALLAVLLIPIFWIGWPVMILALLTPILIYWKVRNASVPEEKRFVLSSEAITGSLADRAAKKALKDAVLVFAGPDKVERPIPPKEDPAFAIHMLAEELLGPALESRASSVELAVTRDGAASGQTVDGIRFKRDQMTKEQGVQLADFIKSIAGLDVEDRRRRQRGSCRVRGPGGRHDLTVTTAGSSNGLTLRIEIDREKQLSRPFDQLGLLTSQRETFSQLWSEEERHGIVLVAAPAGQGLRTSILSLLARHDAYTSNIKSFEREVELELDGVDHVRFDAGNRDADYATQLQSILRRDPDVVQTGFVLDAETAKVIVGPGMEGPLLYVPMRAGSVAECLQQWVKLVGDAKTATKALRAVSVQRLVRTLCPNCRQPYAPTAEQRTRLHLAADKVQQLYRPGGQVLIKNKPETCPICRGTGYLGQTGVFEVMPVDKAMRKTLGEGDLKGAYAAARRNKMMFLQEAAIQKVASGDTSIEEVARVTASASSGGSSKPRPAAPAPA